MKPNSFFFIVPILFLLVIPPAVFAVLENGGGGSGGYDFNVPLPPMLGVSPGTTVASYIRYLFVFGLAIGGLLAFAMLVVAGIKYAASGANPGWQNDAKDQITQAIFGLLLLLFSVLILNTINPSIVRLRDIDITPPPPPPPSVDCNRYREYRCAPAATGCRLGPNWTIAPQDCPTPGAGQSCLENQLNLYCGLLTATPTAQWACQNRGTRDCGSPRYDSRDSCINVGGCERNPNYQCVLASQCPAPSEILQRVAAAKRLLDGLSNVSHSSAGDCAGRYGARASATGNNRDFREQRYPLVCSPSCECSEGGADSQTTINPEILNGLRLMMSYIEFSRTSIIVTSYLTGRHSPNSTHYRGWAVDFAPQAANRVVWQRMVDWLNQRYPAGSVFCDLGGREVPCEQASHIHWTLRP